MSGFELAAAFEATTAPLGELALCEARLQRDARWPWIILIPRRAGAREIDDLDPGDRVALIEEAVLAGSAVRAIGAAIGWPVEKLNTGALGNITRQLHVHIVGRRAGDPAWPGPVWGIGAAEPYGAAALDQATAAARRALGI
jgi:diadenosine tetraphosphate (Ap4A) HIT family hydrolase